MSRIILSLLCLLTCTQWLHAQQLYTPAAAWPVKTADGWFTAKTITYGAYSTSDRKNGIADAASLAFAKDVKDPFNFKVSGNDEKILVQVGGLPQIAFSTRSLPRFLDELPGTTALFYALINGTKNEPLVRWELILKNATYLELNEDKPVGVLRSADEEIRVTAHNHFGAVNSYEKICIEFHYRKLLAAAVIAGPNPQVWVGPSTPARLQPVLAAAIGAILLR